LIFCKILDIVRSLIKNGTQFTNNVAARRRLLDPANVIEVLHHTLRNGMAAEDMIGRCLDTLEMLAMEPRGLPLTTVSQRLGLVKSATHRLLTELQTEGYVAQEPESQQYHLTMRLPTLGFRLLSSSGIVEAAKRSLDTLAQKTGELVRMTVAEDDQLTWVARAQGAQTRLRFDPETGKEVQLHTTASARIWLASLPEDQALAMVQEAGFGSPEEYGPNAIRSSSEMSKRIRNARRDGFAIAMDEGEHGMSAVAVIIPHPHASAIALGTVSIAGPTSRLDQKTLESLVPDLHATAAELSALWPKQALELFGRHLEQGGIFVSRN
jgi:IclR family acetate operon transcriptional repressor